MAGNILGEPINGTISDQIAVRQKYYGDPTFLDPDRISNLREKRIQLNQQHSPFIRLSSSVNITDKKVLTKHNIPEDQDDNTLAKNMVLFNGSSIWGGEYAGFSQRGGLNKSGITITDEFDDGAYGIGGVQDWGQTPMPGINSIQVNYKNRGSLRQASISLTAYNPTQFNMIDLLYLRLGYTVLLEWGHNVYMDNNEEIQQMEVPTFYNDFIEGKRNYYSILRKISRERVKKEGNYDAMLGKVTNFNWNFTPEGNYEISITLTSIGDVIESINTSAISYGVTSTAYENKIDELKQNIYDIENEIADAFEVIAIYDGQTSLVVNPLAYAAKEQLRYLIGETADGEIITDMALATPESRLGKARKALDDFVNGAVDPSLASSRYIEASAMLSNLGAAISQDISKITEANKWRKTTPKLYWGSMGSTGDYHKIIFPGFEVSGQEQSLKGEEYYIRFKYLLQLIEDKVCFNYKTEGGSYDPCLKFDKDSLRSLIYINESTLPADPRILTFKEKEYVFDRKKYKINVCKMNDFRDPNNKNIGRLLNLYINVKYILTKVNEGNSKPSGTPLFDLLKYICDGINNSLGGVNKIEPVIDESTNTVRFIDQTQWPKDVLKDTFAKDYLNPNKTALFQVYGFRIKKGERVDIERTEDNPNPPGIEQNYYEGSFIKDFSIRTEISNKLATQLTIGAQAIGSAVSENATGLQYFNQGIEDRIAPEKTDVKDENDPIEIAASDDIKAAAMAAKLEIQKEQMGDLLKRMVDKNITIDQMNQLVSLNKTFQNLISSQTSVKDKSPTAQGTGFIPININFTMDGLSGIKIYNVFNINSKFLPPNYSSQLTFICTKLNHKVDSRGWETSLESLVVPASVNATPISEINDPDLVPATPPSNATGYYKGTEPQFRDIVVTSIILHITVANHKAQRTIESVGRIGRNTYNTNGIHYAVDRTGTTAAGVPEGKHAAHANEWKDHSIGIEIASYGYVVPVDDGNGGIEYATYYDERANSRRDPGDRSTIPANQVIQLKADDGKPWKWMGHEYFQEYTDVQIAALKTLIEGILSRHDGVKPIAINGLTSAPIKDGIKGSVWTVFGMPERPKSGKDYNRSVISIPPNKDKGKSWDQLGIFTHTTAKTTDHTDPIPTPKLINMLLSLGYTDTEPV